MATSTVVLKKETPITRHDIIEAINNKQNNCYKIPTKILQKFKKLQNINNAINVMQNAQYDQMIGQYYQLNVKFNNAYNSFMRYKTETSEQKDAVNVDEYIKVIYNQSKMCEIDLILHQNQKCGFCREIFEETLVPYTISYCHHKYCISCCNAIILLWIRFDLYPICIVDGCFAKCNEQNLYNNMNIPKHIKNRFIVFNKHNYVILIINNGNGNGIILSDYYEFILNVLKTLDKNLWETIEPMNQC